MFDCTCEPKCISEFRHRVGNGPHVSGVATPTRSPEVADTDAREKRWNRDMPAYRRLRDDGLRPRHIDGSARIEANARHEIEVNGSQIVKRNLKDVVEAKQMRDELSKQGA